MQTKIGFIGAGKVGVSLGKFFREGGLTVTGYYNRHREAAQAAADFTERQKNLSLQRGFVRRGGFSGH